MRHHSVCVVVAIMFLVLVLWLVILASLSSFLVLFFVVVDCNC